MTFRINEEADECVGWLQTIQLAAAPNQLGRWTDELEALLQEAGELRAIFAKGCQTAKAKIHTAGRSG